MRQKVLSVLPQSLIEFLSRAKAGRAMHHHCAVPPDHCRRHPCRSPGAGLRRRALSWQPRRTDRRRDLASHSMLFAPGGDAPFSDVYSQGWPCRKEVKKTQRSTPVITSNIGDDSCHRIDIKFNKWLIIARCLCVRSEGFRVGLTKSCFQVRRVQNNLGSSNCRLFDSITRTNAFSNPSMI